LLVAAIYNDHTGALALWTTEVVLVSLFQNRITAMFLISQLETGETGGIWDLNSASTAKQHPKNA